MAAMTVTEARAAIHELLERVAIGEEVTITRHGQPVAVVVRPDVLRSRRAEEVLASAAELGAALKALRKHGVELEGAADHGVSEALYLRDPDGNGVELYWDRPEEEWPRDAEGGIAMGTRAMDLAGLLAAE